MTDEEPTKAECIHSVKMCKECEMLLDHIFVEGCSEDCNYCRGDDD